jgi:nitrous oxidase accessory protein NosD
MRTFALLALVLLALPARAATIPVAPGQSIQAAIDAAQEGDTIALATGEYGGDLDFRGKAVAVVGVGPDTVLRGTGTGPVVRFVSGEAVGTVLEAVTVTGGVADRGGGLRIVDASPTVVRTVIAGNRASLAGSGVYLERSAAELYNNLIVYNASAGGDPHSIEIQDASPVIVNNTIARGDSNGLIVRGVSSPLIMNNVIAYNGSRVDGDRRGRGICDFSGGRAMIAWNVFHKNRVAALLTDGRDFRRIRGAQQSIAPPRLEGNRDGRPFTRRPQRALADAALFDDFLPRTSGRADAVDAGNPDPLWNDRDGSRNDAGFTGGPFAD